MSETLCAQVAVENTVYHFDKLFTYRVPEALADRVAPGVRVTVPFGAGNRKRIGLVFSLGGEPDPRTKDVAGAEDSLPPLTAHELDLARWLAERYYCTLFEAARLMIPTGLHLQLREGYLLSPAFKDFDREAFSPVAWQILMLLRQEGRTVPAEKLSRQLGVEADSPDLLALLEQGAVQKVNTAASRMKDATSKMVRPLPDFEGKLTSRQQEVWQVLTDAGQASERELCYFTGCSPSVVKALADKGAAEIFEVEVYRRPEILGNDAPLEDIALSDEQQQAYDALLAELDDPTGPRSALLYGVTGSGKTSVFLRLVQTVLARGKGVIVTVPEISLTGQAIRRFRQLFGDGIALFHSGLSLGERMDEWKRVRRGEARIVVGTRSAVFAPVQDLGLIVMDEEQEHTYQSESAPRYDAREVARYRCWQENAFCLLCSATPSVTTYRAAETGRMGLHELKERYGSAVLPQVQLVDMNYDSAPGDSFAIGNTLALALTENYQAGKQSIVLLNRRGYHTFAGCTVCKEVVTCPNCSISLTYHSVNRRLMCHYCGYSVPKLTRCPSCGSESLSYRGLGTQRAEEQLRELLPQARILRVDADSVSARFSLETKLDQFARGEYDVMVGTQMVAKGLDFENVTLVGVLSADQALYNDDFRSSERTFDLLTQVVGRAGRGKYPGSALIQTWAPEHPVLHFAAQQDYLGFYRQEIAFRQAMLYPPFVDLLIFGFVGAREDLVRRGSQRFLTLLGELAAQEYPDLPLRVLQPTAAAVARVGGKYRYKVIVKCRNTPRLREMAARLLKDFAALREFAPVTAYADANPYHIL